jgi:hypothetical protein
MEAQAVADTYHRLEAAYPGRFLLGIGSGHRELGADFRSPYQALVDYLDVLDERGVPKRRRALAALGPRMLKLAAERSAGAYPFLVTPGYTRRARELIARAFDRASPRTRPRGAVTAIGTSTRATDRPLTGPASSRNRRPPAHSGSRYRSRSMRTVVFGDCETGRVWWSPITARYRPVPGEESGQRPAGRTGERRKQPTRPEWRRSPSVLPIRRAATTPVPRRPVAANRSVRRRGRARGRGSPPR